jgi:hypothetical protein
LLAASSWSHNENGASLSWEAPIFVIRAIVITNFRQHIFHTSRAYYPPCEFFIRSFCSSRHCRVAVPHKTFSYQARTGAASGQPIARFKLAVLCLGDCFESDRQAFVQDRWMR